MKILLLMCLLIVGCSDAYKVTTKALPPTGSFQDNYLIVDRAVVEVSSTPEGQLSVKIIKPFFNLLIPRATAYSGSTPPAATLSSITYNNPASAVGFTISQATVAGSYTGDILSFGNFAISGLDDNTLKKCSTSGIESGAGTNKCTQARIRVYTATGDLGGTSGVFCNTADTYCVPLSVNSTVVGVGVANAAYVQTLAIAANKNRLRNTDFTAAQTNFPVSMDMSNAGSGTYTATLVVEYVLRIP